MTVTLSTSVDEHMAWKVRKVAEKEHRSVSNVLSSALTVFTGLPKDVRDALLELQSRPDHRSASRLAREMMAVVARLRLEEATEHLAAHGTFRGSDENVDDIDLLQEATQLTKAARQAISDS